MEEGAMVMEEGAMVREETEIPKVLRVKMRAKAQAT